MAADSPQKPPLKLAALASGRGSNLQAIINACEEGAINAQMTLVLTDNPEAYALERAKLSGIPSVVIERRGFASREAFDSALAGAVEQSGAQLVCLAGFMRIISPAFLTRFPGRVINIHPALLPSFPGLDAQKQAFDHGVKITGCTVHFVDEGVDTGPIIAQAAVEVLAGDTLETLSARILEQEHKLYPKAIQMIADGLVPPRMAGRTASGAR
ncbi:MAG: phosphoribosylglycinamide formyltransferase [Nitrospinae bacterium]|nr:phosphoribosylglycinamide formyltransferase [Nitrospinota bacterium]